MKVLRNFFLLSTAALMLSSCGEKKTVKADYDVIPKPLAVNAVDGTPFLLSARTRIVYPAGNETLQKTAEFLSQYIAEATGYTLRVVSSDKEKAANNIVLSLNENVANAEGYKLQIAESGIELSGSKEAGIFYGIQTLRKSIPATAMGASVEMSPVTIEDAPRFSYRGMHLDVGRHFYSMDFIKEFIDMLALHNLNRFHWHLTEDQGWRLEIKKYPKLTEIGSKRSETVIGHNSGEYDGKPYGGFYTQEQVKEIVAYAQDRFITVIPEIDLPGHMLAAITSYPEFGCTGGPYEVGREWGVFDDVICAGNEDAMVFLEDVLSEVVELFPSEYIHIGGDECPKVRWEKCPKCQSRIKAEKLDLNKAHKPEENLQSYVISRMERFLNEKGRQIIGWDEILEGGLAPNATLMSWRGMAGGIEAAKQKHDVIMTPTNYVYFDYYQTTDVENEPIAIGGYLPVERVYAFEPVPQELTAEEAKYVIGAQANVWTEYIPTSEQVEYMMLPRIAALAEVQWTKPELKDFQDFQSRMPQLIAFYDRNGYNYAKHMYDVTAEYTPLVEEGVLEVKLSSLNKADVIRYTLDGTEPTEASAVYAEPLKLKDAAQLKAAIIRATGSSRVLSQEINLNKASLKPVEMKYEAAKGYTYNGAVALIDGMKGTRNYKTGRWIGFVGNDLELVINLGDETELSSAKTSALVEKGDWIFAPTAFEVAVSNDGVKFTNVASEKYNVLGEKDRNGIYDYALSFEPVKAKFVRVTVKNTPALPTWHGGKGKNAYMFLDEIELN
ncbi:MAG: glycoside hydrolase family 20 protein [Bacteroidales bacterium]